MVFCLIFLLDMLHFGTTVSIFYNSPLDMLLFGKFALFGFSLALFITSIFIYTHREVISLFELLVVKHIWF
jgi:hypothetical protein